MHLATYPASTNGASTANRSIHYIRVHSQVTKVHDMRDFQWQKCVLGNKNQDSIQKVLVFGFVACNMFQ